MKKLLITSLFALFGLISVYSQVTIAPTNLFIEENSRFGTYMVINNSDENQEISINFEFSYSTLNESGRRVIVDDDSLSAEQHSIADNIRAFPQSFILNPGQRQVVRLRIAAPNDLNDGTYWARIKTSATPEAPPVEIEQSDNVTANLGLIIEQVTGLYYKVGFVTTGISVNQITPQLNENGLLEVYAKYERTGNSPFLGSIITSLVDASGEVVSQARSSTTLYFGGTYKQQLNIEGLASGDYTIRMEFVSQRNDISPDEIVQMEPVSSSTSYTIR